MSKQTLCEYSPIRCQVLSEGKDAKGDPVLKVLVKWQQAEKINGNKRRYRKALLEREINRLTPMMKNGEVWGSAYHPEDGVGKVSDITHSWDKVWMDEKTGECFGEISVLPTSAGKDLQIILRKGRIGMSSRGKGTLTHMSEKINGGMEEFDDVNNDYFCLSPGDFVLGASVDDAGPVRILEQEMNQEGEVEEGDDAEIEEFLENASDEEIDAIVAQVEEEEGVDEEVGSMRLALQAAVKADYDPDAIVRDFSNTEVVIQRFEFDPITMRTKDVLKKLRYTISDADEIVLDLNSVQDIQATDYVPLTSEQRLDNPPSLTEEFISLDKAIRDAVKNEFGEAAWVKDFSQDEIVFTAQNPGSPDVLLMIGYTLTDKGIEFVGGVPIVVTKTEDYEVVTEQSLKKVLQKSLKMTETNPNLKAGELSEQEMRLSGWTRKFAAPDLKLSENENVNALSPADRKLLRKKDEKGKSL